MGAAEFPSGRRPRWQSNWQLRRSLCTWSTIFDCFCTAGACCSRWTSSCQVPVGWRSRIGCPPRRTTFRGRSTLRKRRQRLLYPCRSNGTNLQNNGGTYFESLVNRRVPLSFKQTPTTLEVERRRIEKLRIVKLKGLATITARTNLYASRIIDAILIISERSDPAQIGGTFQRNLNNVLLPSRENRNDRISVKLKFSLTDRVVFDAVRLKFHSVRGRTSYGYGSNLGAASRDIFFSLLPFLERSVARIQLLDVSPRPRQQARRRLSAWPLFWQVSGVRVIAEIITLNLEHARAIRIVEIGCPELPDSCEIVCVYPEVLHLWASSWSIARSLDTNSWTFGKIVRSSEFRPRHAFGRSLVLRSSDLGSSVVAQQVLDIQSSLGRHLLEAVIAMVSVVAIRSGAPAHSLMDEVFVVRPSFLHVEVELPAASIFLGSFLGVPNFFSVTPDALLVLVPPAFTDVPLVPVHPRHRKFAQVRARTWLRGTGWNFQKIVPWETRKFFSRILAAVPLEYRLFSSVSTTVPRHVFAIDSTDTLWERDVSKVLKKYRVKRILRISSWVYFVIFYRRNGKYRRKGGGGGDTLSKCQTCSESIRTFS